MTDRASALTREIEGMIDCLGVLTMPIGQTVREIDRIERFLRIRNWMREVNPFGEIEYASPNREWQVQISQGNIEPHLDGYWSLGKFTDGDLPNDAYRGGMEAVGRYESVEEGSTVEALEAAMVAEGVIEWACPYCGEEGGEPRTMYSRYLYGADADGNRGEMREDAEPCCSRCIGK